MSNREERRHWKPADKLRIVLESMNSDAKLAEICRRDRPGHVPPLAQAGWRWATAYASRLGLAGVDL